MFPRPTPVATRPCTKCHTPVQVRRLVVVAGRGEYGEDCAEQLGLNVTKPRLRTKPQTGINLLDLLNGDPNVAPDDCCDGWDR